MENRLIKGLIITIIYFGFFWLLYNERVLIFEVKLGILWKIPLLLYLLFFSLAKTSLKEDKILLAISLLYSIKLILNVSFPEYIFQDTSSALSELFLPLSFFYFKYKYANRPIIVYNFLIYLSIFYLLTSLPFIFGWLETSGLDSSLEHWGGDYNTKLLNGVFFDVALSSKVFAFSTLVIFTNYQWFKNSNTLKGFYFLLVVLGLYSTYMAFTRTGWVSLAMGITIFYLYKTNYKKKTKFIITILFFSVIILIQQDSLTIVQNRLLGIHSVSKKNYSEIDEMTSSRTILYDIAISTIKKADFVTLMIGYGEAQGRQEYTHYINKAMVAHNRFLEITISGGIIALTLFLYMLYLFSLKIYKGAKNNNSSISKTAVILWGLYLFYLFPSHGLPLWGGVILGGYIFLNESSLKRVY